MIQAFVSWRICHAVGSQSARVSAVLGGERHAVDNIVKLADAGPCVLIYEWSL